ncbi:MAG: long-chain fatty acid--CoA ligase [Bdellovibrionales bacterium]|nr:long-chain fatty acid--CoA ligase [Bdellovibrionales bacterium]
MSSTVLHRLSDWAKATPHAPAQRTRVGNGWKTISAKEYLERVFYLGVYLESCGLKPDEITSVLAYNSMEWVHMQLATMLVRGRCAGLYPNSTTKDIHYILNHTEACVLGVQNKAYFEKITAEGKTLPSTVRLIISFDGDTSFSPKAVAYEKAIEEGKKLAGARQVEDYLAKLDPFTNSFIIYTSGTTGNPKGAMLSHDNFTFTADQIARRWKLPFAGDGSLFSFLPLCHVAEQLHSVAVGITQRYLVTYCTKIDNVLTELCAVEPQLLLCVPRFWEKMMEGVLTKVMKGTGPKKALAVWALGVGKRVQDARIHRRAPSPVDAIAHPIADKLVLSKVRKALGLSRANLLASGASPLPAHVSKWFRGLGLEILECYGLTESTGMVSITLRGVDCAGTVGKPLEGCEFRLAEDGEIQSKGRHIFLGYLKDEANTKATLDDGWLRTGDLGEWTSAGLLRIVGRKKEIMKTSGGKMIAPVPIEEKLKEAHLISQVSLVGDNRKYLTALITLSESALADLKAKSGSTKDGVVVDAETIKQVQAELDRVNKSLASFEQVKRFTVLDREFSINDGEMTPTMKMKRNVIEQRFRPLIDQMYN